MNYIDLNSLNKQRMNILCQHNPEHFEWEDEDFLWLIKGHLPKLKNPSSNSAITSHFYKLRTKYSEYSYFDTDKEKFVLDVKKILEDIRQIDPYWSGLYLSVIEETFKLHSSCLISGEGGIGKSYFVKCLEEELEKDNIKHLCVYGKITKDIEAIDFEEIANIGQEEQFVFAFDAINEIDEQNQLELAKRINKIKNIRGVRIIITYRSHTIDESTLQIYRELTDTTYRFSGVSFESVIEWLNKTPIEDISEYLDVLYSNNPFLLSKLPFILNGKQNTGKNNVSRFTYIYEQYIKKSLDVDTWWKTKAIAKFLYDNNKKTFSAEEIENLISEPSKYMVNMEQQGFISQYGTNKYSFVIESLADYLIVRHMWDEIKGKSVEECSRIIKEKINMFYDLHLETVIIMLFDMFSPDYPTIKQILKATNLMDHFDYDTLIKLHFKEDNIHDFLLNFIPCEPERLIVEFAGYYNKPFNCSNYLNNYYIESVNKHTDELSKTLSGLHFLSKLRNRLKNILYFTCKCNCSEKRAKENFYAALWCSSSCNGDIRDLSTKLLFEVLQRYPQFIETAIEIYEKIEDDYIKEAIIYVLSSCSKSKIVETFFLKLFHDYNFVDATSLKRMAVYLGDDYGYIRLRKKNLFLSITDTSKDFTNILHRVDLFEQNLLPFRFWSEASFEPRTKFLSASKDEIIEFNSKLERDFDCVKNGDCNGSLSFERRIAKHYSIAYQDQLLDNKSILSSMEKVFREVFDKYGLSFQQDKYTKQDVSDFSASKFRKCVCIAIDKFYGSLMCNYYTSEFATYNNIQNSIGYEVYDPLEYGEELSITSPLPIFQPQIEKMSDTILSYMDLSAPKDEKWWKDLSVSKENLLKIIQPIKHSKYEWVLLAARISIREPTEDYGWIDTYDIYTCSSSEETIKGDGNDRYLTIEVEPYTRNLLDYASNKETPWLCKSIPVISSGSDVFDETHLILPPSNIISLLQLTLNVNEMCWYNSEGEKIICCNNNKSSYYRAPISGTIFIRKDALEELQKKTPIKYFAFTEKFLRDKGFCDETDYHFEIENGEITKMCLNRQSKLTPYKDRIPESCKKCKYGFYEEIEIPDIKDILANYFVDFNE